MIRENAIKQERCGGGSRRVVRVRRSLLGTVYNRYNSDIFETRTHERKVF